MYCRLWKKNQSLHLNHPYQMQLLRDIHVKADVKIDYGTFHMRCLTVKHASKWLEVNPGSGFSLSLPFIPEGGPALIDRSSL